MYSYLEGPHGKIYLTVNGKEENIILNKGYAEISREWTKGDKVTLVLPMIIHKVVANENVIEDNNKIAFEYGPLVYCAEECDNKAIWTLLYPMISIYILQKNQFYLTK